MTKFRLIALAVFLSSWSSFLLAQARAKPQSFNVEKSGGGNDQDFLVSLPMTLTGETVLRVEFNILSELSLGLEGNMARRRQTIDEKATAETGEALEMQQAGASLLLFRYSESSRMAGFYWGIGAGYRQGYADWSFRPEGKNVPSDMSLLDDQQRLNHALLMKGPTAHIRVGYRYIPESFPISFGAYLGMRHFEAQVDDADEGNRQKARSVTYSEASAQDKERLQRRVATTPEPGLELGIVF